MDPTLESQRPSARKGPSRSTGKLLVSRQEAANLLSISKRALDYLIANRALSARRIGTRVLIPVHDLEQFAQGNHPERLAG